MSVLFAVVFFLEQLSWGQSQPVLPSAGGMAVSGAGFQPAVLKGLKVYPKEPLRFDFILDPGTRSEPDLKKESEKLVRYFLASLTVPEKDLWVNLSPYEKDRIIPEAFGQTEMGRDLLEQDYILKQLTSSLLHPEGETGKRFWRKVYALAQEKYGTTDIPIDTFNKVWIVPDKAVVYGNAGAGAVYIAESRLKVMLEQDYLAAGGGLGADRTVSAGSDIARAVLREVVVPALEKEVNEGEGFARLRQVYQSLILATWYKKKIWQSLLSEVYVNRNKTAGVNIDDPKEAEKIWQRYAESFRQGAYNLIREEKDVYSDEVIPRKYFSGGMNMDFSQGSILFRNPPVVFGDVSGRDMFVEIILHPVDDGLEVSVIKGTGPGLKSDLFQSPDFVPRLKTEELEAWWKNEPDSSIREIKKKIAENLRHISFPEFKSELDRLVSRFNDLRHAYKERPYAVLWDFDKHKSRRWVYSLVEEDLQTTPQMASYFQGASESRTGALRKMFNAGIRDFVIFDDALYGGQQIKRTIDQVNAWFEENAKGERPRFIVAAPFVTTEAESLLQSFVGRVEVELLYGQKMVTLDEVLGAEQMHIFDSIGGVLDQGEESFYRAESLTTFDHKIPDDQSFPTQLVKFYDTTLYKPVYRALSDYFDTEEKDFQQYWDGAMPVASPLDRSRAKQLISSFDQFDKVYRRLQLDPDIVKQKRIDQLTRFPQKWGDVLFQIVRDYYMYLTEASYAPARTYGASNEVEFEAALRASASGIEVTEQGGWVFRGGHNIQGPLRGRMKLNIMVNPQSIQALDRLFIDQDGSGPLIQGNYKSGRPSLGAGSSPENRHDSINIYFTSFRSSDEQEKAIDAVARIVRDYYRDDNLTGTKVADGFWMSEELVGEIPSLDLQFLFLRMQSVAPQIADALRPIFYPDGVPGMSQNSYYAVQKGFEALGLRFTFSRNEGFRVEDPVTGDVFYRGKARALVPMERDSRKQGPVGSFVFLLRRSGDDFFFQRQGGDERGPYKAGTRQLYSYGSIKLEFEFDASGQVLIREMSDSGEDAAEAPGGIDLNSTEDLLEIQGTDDWKGFYSGSDLWKEYQSCRGFFPEIAAIRPSQGGAVFFDGQR